MSLSVVEYTVLDALSRQHGWHMRMQQLSRAAALSPSALTGVAGELITATARPTPLGPMPP